jgi:hypothetical protein
LRVVDLAFRPGGGSCTPARRAFESPMAIACLVETRTVRAFANMMNLFAYEFARLRR